MIVCVLDLDETLGHFGREAFARRPYADLLLKFLNLTGIDIVLWSAGSDEYVEEVINAHLVEVSAFAKYVFGSSECDKSLQKYGYNKASEHVRQLYEQSVFLIGVDDLVSQNMDAGYDLRICPKPYTGVDARDVELVNVLHKIVDACTTSVVMCKTWSARDEVYERRRL